MVNKHKEAVKRQREVAYVQKKEDKKTALETKSINDIIPIVDTFKGCFKLKDGTFMDIVQVKCKDLVNASESDVNFDMYSLTKLYRAYTDDLKIISLNFPTNTKSQQIYFQHKINHTANPLLKNILNENMKNSLMMNFTAQIVSITLCTSVKHMRGYLTISILLPLHWEHHLLSYVLCLRKYRCCSLSLIWRRLYFMTTPPIEE